MAAPPVNANGKLDRKALLGRLHSIIQTIAYLLGITRSITVIVPLAAALLVLLCSGLIGVSISLRAFIVLEVIIAAVIVSITVSFRYVAMRQAVAIEDAGQRAVEGYSQAERRNDIIDRILDSTDGGTDPAPPPADKELTPIGVKAVRDKELHGKQQCDLLEERTHHLDRVAGYSLAIAMVFAWGITVRFEPPPPPPPPCPDVNVYCGGGAATDTCCSELNVKLDSLTIMLRRIEDRLKPKNNGGKKPQPPDGCSKTDLCGAVDAMNARLDSVLRNR